MKISFIFVSLIPYLVAHVCVKKMLLQRDRDAKEMMDSSRTFAELEAIFFSSSLSAVALNILFIITFLLSSLRCLNKIEKRLWEVSLSVRFLSQVTRII